MNNQSLEFAIMNMDLDLSWFEEKKHQMTYQN